MHFPFKLCIHCKKNCWGIGKDIRKQYFVPETTSTVIFVTLFCILQLCTTEGCILHGRVCLPGEASRSHTGADKHQWSAARGEEEKTPCARPRFS